MKTPSSTLVLVIVYVYFARTVAVGFSSDMTGEESKIVSDVLKDLPHAKCDMIVVSSAPFYGKIDAIIYLDINM